MSIEEGFLEKIPANWGVGLIRGYLLIVIGFYALVNPGLSLLAWSLVGGGIEVFIAVRDRKKFEGEGWRILTGLFSMLIGIVLILAPLLSLPLLIQISGAFAIISGGIALYSIFKLHYLKEQLATLSPRRRFQPHLQNVRTQGKRSRRPVVPRTIDALKLNPTTRISNSYKHEYNS